MATATTEASNDAAAWNHTTTSRIAVTSPQVVLGNRIKCRTAAWQDGGAGIGVVWVPVFIILHTNNVGVAVGAI